MNRLERAAFTALYVLSAVGCLVAVAAYLTGHDVEVLPWTAMLIACDAKLDALDPGVTVYL